MPMPTFPLTSFSAEGSPAQLCFEEARCGAAGLEFQVLARAGRLLHLTFSTAAHLRAKAWLHNQNPQAEFASSLHVQEAVSAEFRLYLAGRVHGLCLPYEELFLRRGTGFQQRVWRLLRLIPYGQFRTYGEMAEALGNKKAARAIGLACKANPLALIVPCHRVVAAHGLGGFNGGAGIKERLLAAEGLRRGGEPNMS